MKEPYVIGIRVAGACWGLLELAGFLWFYSAARGAGLNFYWLSPALALLALSMAPGFVTHRPVGNLLLGTLAIIGIVRSLHVFVSDIAANGGPDVGSAFLRFVTCAFIVLLAMRLLEKSKRAGPISSEK